MAYYTEFTLCVSGADITAIVESFNDRLGYNPFDDDAYRFYEEPEVSAQVSELFPNAYILIDGKGGEATDIWRKVYHGGKKVFYWKIDPTPPPLPSNFPADFVKFTARSRT